MARLCLALLTVCFCLGLAEVALRVLDLPRDASFHFMGPELDNRDLFAQDPLLFWRLRQDRDTYAVNTHGFRGPWPISKKNERELRILCLGDSCTFGFGVRHEQAYGPRLENKLQQMLPQRDVSCFLGALPGYSTHQNKIFLREYGAQIKPDVTILYCGVWNDFVPAIGMTDAQRSEPMESGSILHSLRLTALYRKATSKAAASTEETREAYKEAFRGGKAPDGRRVPIAEYRSNLVAMVEQARALGSHVLCVIPPLPAKTLVEFPIAKDYRQSTRQTMQENGVAMLEGNDEFATCIDAYPWPQEEPLGFLDWVHPDNLGHEFLAQALQQKLIPRVTSIQHSQAGGDPEKGPLADATISPVQVSCLESTALQVHLQQELPAAWLQRVELGEQWIPDVQSNKDGLLLQLPPYLLPGDQALRFLTETGWHTAEEPLRVLPVELRATLSKEGNNLVLEVEMAGPPGWGTMFWLSTKLRPQPVQTQFGSFHLAASPDGLLPKLPGLFRFDKLELLGFSKQVDKHGQLLARQVFPWPEDKLPSKIYLQGGLLNDADQRYGVMTQVLTLSLPE